MPAPGPPATMNNGVAAAVRVDAGMTINGRRRRRPSGFERFSATSRIPHCARRPFQSHSRIAGGWADAAWAEANTNQMGSVA